MRKKVVAIFGGGPAGLFAAEILSALGYSVTVYEKMPTVGRKFLLAGKSGLNITHSEDFVRFAQRYGASNDLLSSALQQFTPQNLREWADMLGAETFVGSSGRVFPKAMKASPLLRRWIQKLEAQGVKICTRHKWIGFQSGKPVIQTPSGTEIISCDAALFAFGGASWPRLGSDALWMKPFAEQGVKIAPMRPANCGFDVKWSDFFAERFAGEPVKSVTITSKAGVTQGEFVITSSGVEGSLVYAHSAALRDELEHQGCANLLLDLAPGRSLERLTLDLSRQDKKTSISNILRKGASLTGVKAALVLEFQRDKDPVRLAQNIKALKVPLLRARPIDEAISSAGGIEWSEIDEHYMLIKMPGLFVAGEMIDWEAPTGGYLLTACFATAKAAANGMDNWLRKST
ncbi:TIGR03862 family flavoprotein [Brucella gallinifaecis]|uniref:TIGR03862 family flavoprotein n=1 Tax=Brucella gallinifaecis TaxID=215590 RepID=A0A502BRP3_9HYPH|nr:TIGR03862 family flavoprotein [Brucella gallinifaecis]TPF75946.1 TIGR03862 family flavoprotein [Brucella gallinifaecis]